MVEITEIGWLSLAALAIGVLSGAQIVGAGFAFSAHIEPPNVQAHLTPITIWRGKHQMGDFIAGVNLAGTIVYFEPTGIKGFLQETVEHYELGHMVGWLHYGFQYALKVFEEPCTYDPKAGWAAHCQNEQRPHLLLTPTTGAIRVNWR
uniref:Uncharacterized protein n=1 Tax=Meiothermus ruber TaxID=277 RepID=A0A7C3DY79_MEIRU